MSSLLNSDFSIVKNTALTSSLSNLMAKPTGAVSHLVNLKMSDRDMKSVGINTKTEWHVIIYSQDVHLKNKKIIIKATPGS